MTTTVKATDMLDTYNDNAQAFRAALIGQPLATLDNMTVDWSEMYPVVDESTMTITDIVHIEEPGYRTVADQYVVRDDSADDDED